MVEMGTVLDFGKYEGMRISDLLRKDLGYIKWLSTIKRFSTELTDRMNNKRSSIVNVTLKQVVFLNKRRRNY